MTSIDLNNFTAASYAGVNTMQTENNRLEQLRSEYANPKNKDQKKMKEVSQQFESIFVKQLFDEMDKTVERDDDSLLGGGSSESYFRDMMYDEMSKSMSTRSGGSGLGMAEMVYRQMSNQVSPDQQNSPADQNKVKD